MRDWVALFSQSGSELKEICEMLGGLPIMVMTNNFNKEDWHDNMPIAHMRKHDVIMDSLREIEPSIITLHGYLRIIPADICERHTIINGHPGLITEYPELKGKDPQERITPEMEWIGSVVHEVTEEVDAGKVLTVAKMKNPGGNYYNTLKQTSLIAWENYFNGE